MGEFRDHIYRLMLDRKLYLATVQLQADKKLGRAYSVRLPHVEGLHAMGYLSDADYELYKLKFSVPLDYDPASPTQIREQETKENRDRQLNRHYEEIVNQWNQLSEKAKAYHLKKAETDKHLKWARKVLELGDISHE